MLDVAYRERLGFEALVRLNPGVDEWIPDPGTVVRLPTRLVLPDAPAEGLVLNVPEMRLYDFRAADGPELLVAGDGSYGEELRRLAAGCPRLRFVGRVSPERLDALYQHALALIVPSLCYETFGIILIEAFRQGVPVIARRLGPFPEIVETSKGGLLFDGLLQLQGALRLFEEDAERRLAMGRAGRAAFLAHWSESAVVPRYLDLVRRLQAT